jgi:hypothetical protein
VFSGCDLVADRDFFPDAVYNVLKDFLPSGRLGESKRCNSGFILNVGSLNYTDLILAVVVHQDGGAVL